MSELEKVLGVRFDVEDVEFEEVNGQKYVLIYGNDRNIYPFPLEKKHLKQISERFNMGFVCEECGGTGSIPDIFIPVRKDEKLHYICDKCYVKKHR